MTDIDVVRASAPPDEVEIATLEIIHPAFENGPIRTCSGYEDHTVTLETGETVTFQASALALARPAKNATVRQVLNFAIENVTGLAQHAIEAALEAGGPIRIVFRSYLYSDLSAPAERPLRMVLTGAEMELESVKVEAGYQDAVNYAWPRERYTVEKFPGLKYIG